LLTEFEITDREKPTTKGSNYVYELYTMVSASKDKVQYDMTFDRTILKYGVTNSPSDRYNSANVKSMGIRMNVLNSDISRGEAYYLESLYAMKYAKKYGNFPIDMTDRYGWEREAIDIEWRDNIAH